MKMKILLSVLFPIGLLTIPLFVSAATHSPGTNVLNNGTIYMITTDGQLRPYTSAGAYLSYGFNSWNNVEQANSDDLTLPVGNFIPPRDGKIVCSDRGTDKGTCYLITNGKKAGFTSEDVFNKLGFNFKYVLSGDVSFLPSTDNISNGNQTHLPGTLINDNGTVKLVGTSGTVGVPSMDTLKSWGYSLVDVVNANSSDKTLPQNDILNPRTSGQLTWSKDTVLTPTVVATPVPTPNPVSLAPNLVTTPVPTTAPSSTTTPSITTQPTSTPTTTSSPILVPTPIPTTSTNSTTTPQPTPTPAPTPYLVGAPDVYTEKYRLIRGGQIVGYKKVGDKMQSWILSGQVISTEKSGEKAELYSYENKSWFSSSFPYDNQQKFIEFDSNNLQEVYEGDVLNNTSYTEKYRLFNNQGQLVGFKKVNGDSVIYSYEDSFKGWSTLPAPIANQFTYTTPKRFLQWDAVNFLEIYE